MIANYRSMEAAQADVETIYARWQLLPGSDRSASLMLEDLLDAQERLNAAESACLESQLNYNLSQTTYLRAVGTLLETENISVERFCECHLPQLSLRHSQSLEKDELGKLPADMQRPSPVGPDHELPRPSKN
jgi:hypothetical protein